MLINATVPDEVRIAIVEEGQLIDLDIEAAEAASIKGNIYKGIVHNVEASLEAAFINYGDHKQGFLPFDAVSPAAYSRPWTEKEPPRISDVLKKGQEILVQIEKDAVGETKGAALTTYLSLPGRYTVLMPGREARGVSRKIDDEKARKRIKAVADKVELPEGYGYVIRTAGVGQTKASIQGELERLLELHKRIERGAEIARAPSLLHAEPDIIARTLRDLFTEDIDEVLIDSRPQFESVRGYFEELMPEHVGRLMLYENPIPIFAYYRVEEQLEQIFERRVPMPSGGSIVIDQTEALVAIDVNSGKMTSERDHEDTVYKTNFEAAQVVAAQIRLRDLGGIIVVDFIDMELERNRRAVEKALKDAMKDDKARVKVSRILSNGLCILTRQRIRQGLLRSFKKRCPACDGSGWRRTPESHSLSILKRIETRLAQGGVQQARITTHRETAEHILNQKRQELLALERNYQAQIIVIARPDMEHGQDTAQFLSRGELLAEITDMLPQREDKGLRSGKKKRKKRREAAETAAREAQRELGDVKDESEERRKRKKRRMDKAEAAEARPEAAREAPKEVDGVTFTGRPTPEMIAKFKAEAQARRLARVRLAHSPGAEESERPEAKAPVESDATQRPEPMQASDVPSAPSRRPEEPRPEATRSIEVQRAPAPKAEAAPKAEPTPKAELAPKAEPVPKAEPAPKTSLLQRLLGSRRPAPTPTETKEG